jgi:hypothetical protein
MDSDNTHSGQSFDESLTNFEPIFVTGRAMPEGEGYSGAMACKSGLCDAPEELCVATGGTERPAFAIASERPFVTIHGGRGSSGHAMPIQCDDCHRLSLEASVVRVKVFAALLAHFFVYDLMRFGSVLACDLYRLSMLVWCAVRAVLQVAAC